MTTAQHKSDTELTKDIQCLTLMGELWVVQLEDFEEE